MWHFPWLVRIYHQLFAFRWGIYRFNTIGILAITTAWESVFYCPEGASFGPQLSLSRMSTGFDHWSISLEKSWRFSTGELECSSLSSKYFSCSKSLGTGLLAAASARRWFPCWPPRNLGCQSFLVLQAIHNPYLYRTHGRAFNWRNQVNYYPNGFQNEPFSLSTCHICIWKFLGHKASTAQ